MMKTTKALTIILTLLALTTSASAECAWVRWGGTYGIPGSYGAYQDECRAAGTKEIEKRPDAAGRADSASYFTCWPVGVDPARVANPTVDTYVPDTVARADRRESER